MVLSKNIRLTDPQAFHAHLITGGFKFHKSYSSNLSYRKYSVKDKDVKEYLPFACQRFPGCTTKMQMSEDTWVALSNADSASKKFMVALASGMQDKDWSAIYEITRQTAGLN